MWTALGGVLILGYFGFVVRNLYQVTSPPLCGSTDQQCARSVLSHDTPYLTQIFLSTFPAKNFHYEIDKKHNVTLLVPTLPRTGSAVLNRNKKRLAQDDDDDDDFDEEEESAYGDDLNGRSSTPPTVIRLGSIITSVNSVHSCDGAKIIPSPHSRITVDKQSVGFIRRHILFHRDRGCRVIVDAKLADHGLWRSNNTRVFVSVSATSIAGVNSEVILRPVTQLLSTMYSPDKKKRIKKRYLLNPSKKVSSNDANPLFGGKPYMAVPKRIKVGPIAIDKPLSVRELERTYRKHWLYSEERDEYAPDIYVNTLVSPRDEYQPLPIDLSDRSDESDESEGSPPSIRIELDAFAWRKYALESLMLHSISQMESTLGTSQYDSDSLKLLLAGESPLILLVTLCVSVLHMLFEYLALSSNWSYFQAATKDAKMSERVSRRAILLDLVFEVLILAWLWDDGEAKIVQVVLGCRIVFNIWRYTKLRAAQSTTTQSKTATGVKRKLSRGKRNDEQELNKQSLELTVWRALSLEQLKSMRSIFTVDEFESQALWSLSVLLIPLLIGMALYQLIWVPQKGWLSWIIKTGALASYAGGFIAMTPQLYKNYYFKSVEHLPWTTLTYQFLNTIIDDLFSFLIRMPNAHRMSVFRDDIIFVIYWIQKRHYRHELKNKSRDISSNAKKND